MDCSLRIMFRQPVFNASRWVLLVALMLTLSACSWDRIFRRQYVVTEIPVGDGRTVVISTDSVCEISCSILYEVKVGDETVSSMCRIAYGDAESLTFKTLFAKGGNLVAIYEETWPERLLLLHDFSTGKGWPRSLPDEYGTDTDGRGVKLLAEMQKEHPERKYLTASGDAAGIGAVPPYSSN